MRRKVAWLLSAELPQEARISATSGMKKNRSDMNKARIVFGQEFTAISCEKDLVWCHGATEFKACAVPIFAFGA